MSLPALKGKYYPGSFTTIPFPVSALIQMIGPGPYAVYSVLCERADGDTGICNISNARLAAESGMGLSQMRVHKRVLVRFGLIKVTRRFGGRKYDQVPITQVLDAVRGPSGVATQHWLYAFNPDWAEVYPDRASDARGDEMHQGGFDVDGNVMDGGIQRPWMREILNQYSWGPEGSECVGPKQVIKVFKAAGRSEPGQPSVARQIGEEIRSVLRRTKKRKREPK